MAQPEINVDVYVETGQKRTFVGAIEWPGWTRIGRDEETALQALHASAPRYAHVLHAAGIEFQAPHDLSAFTIVERLEGTATTDFGAPDATPSADEGPVDAAVVRRFQDLLQAYWQAFDAATQAAAGKELRKGPRGGGRDLEGIIRHVVGADGSYLTQLRRKLHQRDDEDLRDLVNRTREAVIDALDAAARGEIAERGPRGGRVWTARYFVRRLGWHVLDHTWEIEDRVM